jgi:type I restriction enzyme, S subunit
VTLLGEVADFEMGQAPPGTECNTDGVGTLFVKAGEFGKPYPLEREWTTKPLKLGRRGDIFICVVGATAGKLNLGIDCAIGRSVAAIRPSSDIETKFLYYQLQPWVLKLRAASAGSAQGVISKKQLAEIPIEVPRLNAQLRIVAEIEKQFSRLDEAVANLQRVKANLKRYTATVLHAAIAGRLLRNGDAMTVGVVANELPPGWQLVRTDQAGDVLLGRQRAPQYLTGEHTKKYLRVANIKDDAINYDDVESMDFDETHFAKYRLTPGDILVSEGQSPELLGQSAIFRGHAEPLCFQKTLHRFRARPGITTAEFAQIVFRAHVKSGVFRRIGSITTNIGHLTLEKFRAAPFPLPPLAEQQGIVAEVDRRLSIVRGVEAEVDTNLKRAHVLRETVLVRAFTAH